jgi:nitrogen fixation NifU-like protein
MIWNGTVEVRMNDKLDDWAKELQETILSEAEEHHGPQVLERWRSPKNWGTIGKPDGFSRITGPCGDTMQIGLKVEGNRITEIKYTTDGCATSIASGSMATELAYSKSLDEAQGITPEMILEALGGLPEESEHCALLASNVLRAAMQDYRKSRGG